MKKNNLNDYNYNNNYNFLKIKPKQFISNSQGKVQPKQNLASSTDKLPPLNLNIKPVNKKNNNNNNNNNISNNNTNLLKLSITSNKSLNRSLRSNSTKEESKEMSPSSNKDLMLSPLKNEENLKINLNMKLSHLKDNIDIPIQQSLPKYTKELDFLNDFPKKVEPKLTRDNWKKHDLYYESGANKFINIHQTIRGIVDDILSLIVNQKVMRAHAIFKQLNDLLDMHHKVEEKNLFPYLKKIDKIEEVMGLDKDHEEMNHFLAKLSKIFYTPEKSNLLETFTAFKNSLFKHLEVEEDITIPVIILNGFRFSCCTNVSKKTCCFY